MRTAGIVIGLLLAIGGAVWVLQGLDIAFAPRSFMTADRTWVWIGAITVVAGAVLVGWSLRRRT